MAIRMIFATLFGVIRRFCWPIWPGNWATGIRPSRPPRRLLCGPILVSKNLRSEIRFFPICWVLPTVWPKEQQRSQQRHHEIAGSLSENVLDSQLSQDYGLERAIAALPDSYRELILLRYYGGYSCPQVAEQLNMPLGTVTKTLSRAYAELRKSLRHQQNDRNCEV